VCGKSVAASMIDAVISRATAALAPLAPEQQKAHAGFIWNELISILASSEEACSGTVALSLLLAAPAFL
jgi:hypothetical protein